MTSGTPAQVERRMASNLPVQTFEVEVSCGAWCQGGSASFSPTTFPEYTDVSEVWVTGSDAAFLAHRVEQLEAALKIIAGDSGIEATTGRARTFADVARAALANSPKESA